MVAANVFPVLHPSMNVYVSVLCCVVYVLVFLSGPLIVSEPLFWFEILNLAHPSTHTQTHQTISTKHILK